MCTVLVKQMWLVLFQAVSWPGFNVHSSGDTDMACLVSASELAWFLMCTPLVTQTVACLVPDGELAQFLMCTLLVTQTVACLISEGSWPGFECTCFW